MKKYFIYIAFIIITNNVIGQIVFKKDFEKDYCFGVDCEKCTDGSQFCEFSFGGSSEGSTTYDDQFIVFNSNVPLPDPQCAGIWYDNHNRNYKQFTENILPNITIGSVNLASALVSLNQKSLFDQKEVVLIKLNYLTLLNGATYKLKFKAALFDHIRDPQFNYINQESSTVATVGFSNQNDGDYYCKNCTSNQITIDKTFKEFEITFTEEECNTNYIALEVKRKDHLITFLIDDIIIEQISPTFSLCSSQTTGINVTCNNAHKLNETPLTFSNLKNVSSIHLNVYEKVFGGDNLKYSNTIDKPNDFFIWDGKDGVGNLVPNGNYRYVLDAYNEISCTQIEGEFDVDNTVPNYCLNSVTCTQSVVSGRLVINNVDCVHELKLDIYTSNGSFIMNALTLNNPDPSKTIAWNGKDNNGNYLTSGGYQFKLTVANNCSTRVFGGSFSYQDYYYINTTTYYDYSSVTKPDYTCNFANAYTNYYPVFPEPILCCDLQPDLTFTNGYFGGSRTYQASGNIYINGGVNVVPGSTVNIKAGGSVVEINPGTVIDPGVGGIVIIENEPCSTSTHFQPFRIANTGTKDKSLEIITPIETYDLLNDTTIANNPSYSEPEKQQNFTEDKISNRTNEIKPENQIKVEKEKTLRLIPNPNKGQFIINGTYNSPVSINIIDITGRVIYFKDNVILNGDFAMNLENIRRGIYSVKISEGVECKVLRLVIE